jgi:tRNA U34 5-methylaminomethyl-2-thiouridine-forming methyltransferase MnmC
LSEKFSLLNTYSSKGNVKRSLKEAGFKIEKLPGSAGKREFLRAFKK